MAKIERFEDLQSWQKARQLTNAIYDLTEHQNFAKDFQLRNQIRDAAGSVMHNIAEGFDSGTKLSQLTRRLYEYAVDQERTRDYRHG
jgi:four helix bundle protein